MYSWSRFFSLLWWPFLSLNRSFFMFQAILIVSSCSYFVYGWCPFQKCSSVLLCSSSSGVWGLTLRIWSILNWWFWLKMVRSSTWRDLVFTEPFVKCGFAIYVFWQLCQKLNGYKYVSSFLHPPFYSIGSHAYFCASIKEFLLPWPYSTNLHQVSWWVQLFLLPVSLTIWRFSCFHMNFSIVFSSLMNK